MKEKKYLLLAFCILGLSQIALGVPHIASGTGTGSVIIADAPADPNDGGGFPNTAAGNYSSAIGLGNKASGEESSVFGSLYGVTGNESGAWGVGRWDNALNDHVYKNEGTESYMLGNRNQIAAGTSNNFIMGNGVSIGAGVNNAVVLGAGSEAGESNTVSVGSAAQKRKIVNVADGVADSDAATYGQLKQKADKDAGNLSATDVAAWKTKLGVGAGTGGSVDAYTKAESDNKFANKEELRKTKKELRGIGSLSAALAGLHPMQYDKNAPSQVMAALGNYRDKQAIAVGVSHYFSPNAMMSAGVALSNEKRTNAMANVGFTWKLGKGGSQVPMDNASVVQSEVRRLTLENQEQRKENAELKARVQKLEEALNTLLKK